MEVLALLICLGTSLLMLALPDDAQIVVANRLSLILTQPYWRLRNFGEDVLRVRRENGWLRARVAELELRAANAERAARDSLRLAGATGLPPGYAERLLPCQVVARELQRSVTMIKIRSAAPVRWRLYEPVLSPEGLLGRVRRVGGPEEAWVELLTAPDMALGCEIERTGLLGVLRTRGGDFLLDMIGRDEDDVREGDLIITSGLAEVRDGAAEGWTTLPRGLPVGTVRRVQKSAAQLFLDVEVEPRATFTHNATVFLLRSEREAARAAAWSGVRDARRGEQR
jgi:cell shape-determining protein MreC